MNVHNVARTRKKAAVLLQKASSRSCCRSSLNSRQPAVHGFRHAIQVVVVFCSALATGVSTPAADGGTTRRPMQQQPPTAALIIDCGSGFTRAAVFSRASSGAIRACEAHSYAGLPDPWKQPKIVDVLVKGGAALREWVSSVQALIDLTGCSTTVLGATGGLRQAEADGTVAPDFLRENVRKFRDTYEGLF